MHARIHARKCGWARTHTRTHYTCTHITILFGIGLGWGLGAGAGLGGGLGSNLGGVKLGTGGLSLGSCTIYNRQIVTINRYYVMTIYRR